MHMVIAPIHLATPRNSNPFFVSPIASSPDNHHVKARNKHRIWLPSIVARLKSTVYLSLKPQAKQQVD